MKNILITKQILVKALHQTIDDYGQERMFCHVCFIVTLLGLIIFL